jgi:hypothetical protein
MCLAMLLRDRDPKYEGIASFTCYSGYFMGSDSVWDQHKDRTLERCKRYHAQQLEEDLLKGTSSPDILGSPQSLGKNLGNERSTD